MSRLRFYLPHGLTVDDRGQLWVTDVGSHQVFKLAPLAPPTASNGTAAAAGGGGTVDPARTRPEPAAGFGRRPFLQADVGGRGARQRRVLRCRRLLQLAHHQVQRGRRQIGRVGREDGSVFSSQFTQLTPIDDFDSFIFFLSVFSSIVARRNL